MDKALVAGYAKFAVQTGCNVQNGQTLIIRCPVVHNAFARLCAEAAYDAGAKEVVVMYNDEQMSRIKMERTELDVLCDIKPWQLASYMDYAADPSKLATLAVISPDPEIYKGLDSAKVSKVLQATSKAMRPFQELSMTSQVQWSIVAVPSEAWATRVFPDMQPEEAVERLWEVILQVCRAENGDPVGEWEKHVEKLGARRDWMNSLNLESIRLQSANGTDLTVGLADNHVWAGAEENSTAGVPFLANIPTEEVFTAPHLARTEGVVKSSMPYVYGGNLIKGISVRFEKGVAVEYTADEGADLLKEMLSPDEGALHIGEIALVPASSPIRQSGILFYNTLFDENAACHMAFGKGYPGTVKGGEEMDIEQLKALGVNDSLIHEDVMIGTEDMDITGLTKDGRTVQIFTKGEWSPME